MKGSVGWKKALVYDLSASGAAVCTATPLPLESEVRVRFRLPSDGATYPAMLEILGLVVGAASQVQHDRELPCLVGVHFLALDGADFDRVRAFVWRLLHPDER